MKNHPKLTSALSKHIDEEIMVIVKVIEGFSMDNKTPRDDIMPKLKTREKYTRFHAVSHSCM